MRAVKFTLLLSLVSILHFSDANSPKTPSRRSGSKRRSVRRLNAPINDSPPPTAKSATFSIGDEPLSPSLPRLRQRRLMKSNTAASSSLSLLSTNSTPNRKKSSSSQKPKEGVLSSFEEMVRINVDVQMLDGETKRVNELYIDLDSAMTVQELREMVLGRVRESLDTEHVSAPSNHFIVNQKKRAWGRAENFTDNKTIEQLRNSYGKLRSVEFKAKIIPAESE